MGKPRPGKAWDRKKYASRGRRKRIGRIKERAKTLRRTD